MAIRDVAAMNASLDNDYGTGAGAASPTHHLLALFSDDPMGADDWSTLEVAATNDASEATGYARVQINPADWSPAENGEKATTLPVSFPDPTAAWDVSVTHAGLVGSDGVLWDCWPLSEEIVVAGAGEWLDPVAVVVSVADSIEPEGDEE